MIRRHKTFIYLMITYEKPPKRINKNKLYVHTGKDNWNLMSKIIIKNKFDISKLGN